MSIKVEKIFCPYKLTNGRVYWAWKDKMMRKKWELELREHHNKIKRITKDEMGDIIT